MIIFQKAGTKMDFEDLASTAKLALFLALVALLGCHHVRISGAALPPAATAAAQEDSITLISVRQVPETALQHGKSTQLIATIRYTLSMIDHAHLTVNLDQFSSHDTCTSSDEDAANRAVIQLPPEKAIPIMQGTHTVEIHITWPGDTGEGTNGRTFGAGAISLRASMGTDHPNYEFLTRRFGTQYCMQF
jgi:hypothetical protein